MARDGIEPPTHGASIHCSTNWATEPYCGSRIWTYDLRVMSPTSYLAAPSRVNYKEDVGFEPTHAFTRLTVFKTVPFSRTWVILQYNIVRTGFEPVLPPWKGGVLTPWPTDHFYNVIYYISSFSSVNTFLKKKSRNFGSLECRQTIVLHKKARCFSKNYFYF